MCTREHYVDLYPSFVCDSTEESEIKIKFVFALAVLASFEAPSQLLARKTCDSVIPRNTSTGIRSLEQYHQNCTITYK